MSLLSESKNLCRVCLEEGADVSLFQDDEDMKLYLKIMACSTVQITEADGYPCNICPLCYSMLDTAYKFKIKCEDTDVKLRTCVTKHYVKVEMEECKDNLADDDYNMADVDELCDVNIKIEYNTDEEKTDTLEILDDNFNKSKEKRKKTKSKNVKSEKIVREERNKQVREVLVKEKAEEEKPAKEKLKKDKSVKVKPEKELKLENEQRLERKRRERSMRFGRYKSGRIASSLLEGQCVWNNFTWRFCSQHVDTKEELKAKKEADRIRKILVEERNNESNERLKYKDKTKKRCRNKLKSSLCDTCGKVFSSGTHLRIHHKIAHENILPTFRCPEPDCDKSFRFQDYLNRHVKRFHGEQKTYICDDCGKQFRFVNSLRTHINAHAGIINWKLCPHCPQKYKSGKSREIHIKSAHTGERPHACSLCDSAFFHHDYLKEHMRLHTGETPFKCPICKRGYAQRGNMKSHMKQHKLSELSEELRATMKPNYIKLLRDC